MALYWLLYLIPAAFALNYLGHTPLQTDRRAVVDSVLARTPWVAVTLALALIIGFRYTVGGDWYTYLAMHETVAELNWQQSMVVTEPAYGLLDWFGAQMGGGVYLVNFVCGLVFSWGLAVFCRDQPRPWLALTVAIPYLVVVVAMGYTRQSAAIGLAMTALVVLQQERIVAFLGWSLLAVLFHKSAVLLIPLAALYGRRNLWIRLMALPLVVAVVFVFFLKGTADQYTGGYVTSGYSSSGAAIRVAMNAFPSLLFIVFNRRFGLPREQNTFWLWMAWGALLLVGALLASPSSTAVDRVALYWIPIQMVVWSRLPDAMAPQGQGRLEWGTGVIVYNAVVMFTWLVFGTNAYNWLPYRFYPWIALWE